MSATTTTFTNALKLIQQGYIEETQNLVPQLLNLMDVGEEGLLGGQGWQPSFTTVQNESATAILESDDLPAAQQTSHEKALVTPKIYVSRIQLTGKLLAAAKNDTQAYTQAEMREFKSALQALRKTMNQHSYEDGTPVIGTATATATSTTHVLDTILGVSRLRNGMIIDTFTGSTRDNAAITIVSVDAQASAGPTVVFSSSITLDSGDTIVRADIRGTGSDEKALIGLDAVFDNSSDYYGLDRTSGTATSNFDAQVLNLSGALTEDAMFIVRDRVDRQGAMALAMNKVNITERVQQRQYFDLLKSARRFMDPMDYMGGYQSVSHEGYSWITDDDCARDVMYFLAMDHWKKYTLDGDIHIASHDGLRIRNVSGKDAFESYLVYYGNIACLHPRLQGKLTGLTRPTV